MKTKYKLECFWSPQDGWHFSFGEKRLWEIEKGYTVADIDKAGTRFINQQKFTDLRKAIDYMKNG